MSRPCVSLCLFTIFYFSRSREAIKENAHDFDLLLDLKESYLHRLTYRKNYEKSVIEFYNRYGVDDIHFPQIVSIDISEATKDELERAIEFENDKMRELRKHYNISVTIINPK